MLRELKDLELMFDMTSHPGWKLFTQDIEGRLEQYKEALIRPQRIEPYELGTAHGHAFIYAHLLNLRNALEQEIELKTQEENEPDGEEDLI